MKDDLRLLAINAKVFQYSANLFAILGVLLFMYLFFSNFRGNPMMALHDPTSFVMTILLPFIPAAVLAAIAAGKRKRIKALLDQGSKSP